MASKSKFRHEDIRAVPKGYKVRNITHPSGHQVRVAYPPGPRRKGSGEVISVLHPITGQNPCPNPCKFNPGFVESAKAKLEATKERIKALFSGEKSKRNYTEVVSDSSGKKWYVDVASSGKRFMAEGYPVSGKKIPRVGKPKVAYGPSESEAYDALLTKIEPNPFPPSDYLVVGDPKKSTTYHLQVKKHGEPDHRLMGGAHAALFADHRGKPYMGPEKEQAKARLRELYRSEGMKWPAANPCKGKRKRKNLDEIKPAAELAAKFKGSPAENVREIDLSNKQRDDYAHLGWMQQEVFHPAFDHAVLDLAKVSEDFNRLYQKYDDSVRAWREVAQAHGAVLLVFDLTGDEIELASSADGKQLYFLGGNQASFKEHLGQFRVNGEHDKVDLGDMIEVIYEATKKQAGDREPRDYYHVFGEQRGGVAPRAYYDMLNKRMFLTGGSYHVKEPERGIIN
jgi:hypothetical protein